VFSFGIDITNMFFIGHTNDSAKIAGIGLGNLYINITSQAIILGLNGAISTLASQAFGAKNMHKVGVYLNRGRYIGLMCFIPQAFLLMNCERALLMLGQDPQASAYAQEYAHYMIISMLAHT
jgi:MATE family multidrug resistance protein